MVNERYSQKLEISPTSKDNNGDDHKQEHFEYTYGERGEDFGSLMKGSSLFLAKRKIDRVESRKSVLHSKIMMVRIIKKNLLNALMESAELFQCRFFISRNCSSIIFSIRKRRTSCESPNPS